MASSIQPSSANHCLSPKQEFMDPSLEDNHDQGLITHRVCPQPGSTLMDWLILFQPQPLPRSHSVKIPVPSTPSEAQLLIATAQTDYHIHIIQKDLMDHLVHYAWSTIIYNLSKPNETSLRQSFMSGKCDWLSERADTIPHWHNGLIQHYQRVVAQNVSSSID